MGDTLGAARRTALRLLYQAGCAWLTEGKAARGSRAPWRTALRRLYQASCARLTDEEKFSAGGRVVEVNFFVEGIPVTAQTVYYAHLLLLGVLRYESGQHQLLQSA